MKRTILAAPVLTAFVFLPAVALAQRSPASADKPTTGSVENGDDAMTDVDPEVLARCSREAAQRKLKAQARTEFMHVCVEPED